MKLLHSLVALGRRPAYAIETSIWQDKSRVRVFKKALTPQARRHIQTIAENCRILNNLYGADKVAQSWQLAEDCLEMEYVGRAEQPKTMLDEVSAAMRDKDIRKLSELLTLYRDEWIMGGQAVCPAVYDFTDEAIPHRDLNIDLSLDNLVIIGQNKYKIIDYEWLYAGLPPQFTFYRSLLQLTFRCEAMLAALGLKDEALLALSGDYQRFAVLNESFMEAILDRSFMHYSKPIQDVQFE